MRIPYKYRVFRRINDWHWNKVGYPLNFKYYWQRITRGWCNADTWNLDTYLEKVIADTMRFLAKNGCGYPVRAFDENGNVLYSGFADDTGEEICKENEADVWKQVLLDIAEGMDASYKAEYFTDEEETTAKLKLDKALGLMKNNWASFWD